MNNVSISSGTLEIQNIVILENGQLLFYFSLESFLPKAGDTVNVAIVAYSVL
jgi:hypothetical protein